MLYASPFVVISALFSASGVLGRVFVAHSLLDGARPGHCLLLVRESAETAVIVESPLTPRSGWVAVSLHVRAMPGQPACVLQCFICSS